MKIVTKKVTLKYSPRLDGSVLYAHWQCSAWAYLSRGSPLVPPPPPLQACSGGWDAVPPVHLAAPLLLLLGPSPDSSIQRNISTKAYLISFDQYPLESNEGLLPQMSPTFPLGINYAYSSPPLVSETQGKLATGDGLFAQISCDLSSQDRVW